VEYEQPAAAMPAAVFAKPSIAGAMEDQVTAEEFKLFYHFRSPEAQQ